MAAVFVAALTNSAYYILLGLGIVLIYRQSGVLNFSLGPVASLAAYVAYALIKNGTPYWVAAAAGVIASAAASAAIELLIVRRLHRQDAATVAIATFGPGLIMIGLFGFIFGNAALPLPAPFQGQFDLGFVKVGQSEVFAMLLALIALAGIYLLLQRTKFGISLRAASEGPVTAAMLGIDVSFVRTAVWALSGALAGFAALLISAHYYLEPTFMTTFKFGSFAAIVLGGMESIAGLAIGSLLFGVLAANFAFFVTGRLLQTLNFITITVVLTIFPYGVFGRRLERVAEPRIKDAGPQRPKFSLKFLSWRPPRLAPRVSRIVRIVLIAVAVFGLAVLPWLIGDSQLYLISSIAAMFVAAAGLNFISGYAGQGSLGQAGFIGIGAYVYALLEVRVGAPSILAAIAAVAAAAAAGLIFGKPAMRLSGVYLAMITLAFCLAIPELAAFPEAITGGTTGLAVSSDLVDFIPTSACSRSSTG